MAKKKIEETQLENVEESSIDSFLSPESSNIAGASYNSETQELEVCFTAHSGGPIRRYRYQDFPFNVWAKFKESESKGKFFGMEIRPKFEGKFCE